MSNNEHLGTRGSDPSGVCLDHALQLPSWLGVRLLPKVIGGTVRISYSFD